ncbi:MAG: hypothetical protein AAGK09_02340 [Planctomycetota bacterium]
MTPPTAAVDLKDCNRLGLDLHAEAAAMRDRYPGPLIDAHVHLFDAIGAKTFFDTADAFNVTAAITQTPLENVDAVADASAGRARFVAVPDYWGVAPEIAYTTDYHKRLETFAEKGARMFKIWAGPRGIDRSPTLAIDHPSRAELIDVAKSLGYTAIMTHVGDPDTWYAKKYLPASKYGTKQQHLDTLARLIEQHGDRPWLGAHMGGTPEDLDTLQTFLDRFPTYVVDTSATKWIIRELSQRIDEFADFVKRNPGRVLWGTDIVAHTINALPPDEARQVELPKNAPPIEIKDDAGHGFDLYGSRFWAKRTLCETDYDGLSTIVDPDLHMVDESVDPKSTATLRGAGLDHATLKQLYHDNAADFIERVWG